MPRRSSHPVLAARVAYLESQAKEARNLAAALNKQNEQLQRENRALELEFRMTEADEGEDAKDLAGLTVLYVGGRPGLLEQLRQSAMTVLGDEQH
jgi:hypothetical protein